MRKTTSRILRDVHETASELHEKGFLSDAKMKEFDDIAQLRVSYVNRFGRSPFKKSVTMFRQSRSVQG